MDRLIVKKFGPIKDICIDVNRVNILIGTQGSGKSTIAKLLSIMNDPSLPTARNLDILLAEYNLNFYLNDDTYIEFTTPQVKVIIRGNRIEHSLSVGLDEKRITQYTESIWKASKENLTYFQANMLSVIQDMNDIDLDNDSLYSLLELTDESTVEDQLTLRKSIVKDVLTRSACRTALDECIYVPAERNIVTLINDNYFALGDSTGLPKFIWKFGARYERARKSLDGNTIFDIPFINDLHYRRNNKKDEIIYNGVTSSLAHGSSGFQSSIPLAVVCSFINKRRKSLFIIEEPEQNLYPVTQYRLVKFLASICLKEDSKLFITTHSPYILTSFINLIQAHDSGSKKPRSTAKIIPKEHWIDFKDVSAYFIDEGRSKDILDYDAKSIFAEEIDNASFDISNEYNKLLSIYYSKR